MVAYAMGQDDCDDIMAFRKVTALTLGKLSTSLFQSYFICAKGSREHINLRSH
jgi:hypothetical protein